MKATKTPIQLDDNVYLLIVDDGEEWCAVSEAFNRRYPDRADKPFDPANYTQAEIDAVMVEFEPKQKPQSTPVSPATSD
jgi:hypothetical protein